MEQLQQTKRNPMASAALMLGLFAIGLAFIIPVYGLFCGCFLKIFASLLLSPSLSFLTIRYAFIIPHPPTH